jgi:hypothetical protein
MRAVSGALLVFQHGDDLIGDPARNFLCVREDDNSSVERDLRRRRTQPLMIPMTARP